jgi:5-methylcytosine-specific restriction endonuclease McrA
MLAVAADRPQAERRPLRGLRTLVLNADFRPLSAWPLSLMPAQEAVHALLRDRVAAVENWPDAFYRSPSMSIAVPKVVALREYAPVRGEPKCTRINIYLRDRFRCQYCGERFERSELTYDHVIPRAKGGKTVWTNILTACVGCNGRKRDQLPNFSGRKGVAGRDGSLRPLKEPRRPTGAELARAGLELLPDDVIADYGSWLYWHTELKQ